MQPISTRLLSVLYFSIDSQTWEALLVEHQTNPIRYSIMLCQAGSFLEAESFVMLGDDQGIFQTSDKHLALLVAWQYALANSVTLPNPIAAELLPKEVRPILRGTVDRQLLLERVEQALGKLG